MQRWAFNCLTVVKPRSRRASGSSLLPVSQFRKTLLYTPSPKPPRGCVAKLNVLYTQPPPYTAPRRTHSFFLTCCCSAPADALAVLSGHFDRSPAGSPSLPSVRSCVASSRLMPQTPGWYGYTTIHICLPLSPSLTPSLFSLCLCLSLWTPSALKA